MGEKGPGNLSDVKLLITGGAGFIGSNYVRWVLANTDDEVIVYDALTYAGNESTLQDVAESSPGRYRFIHADVCDLEAFTRAVEGQDAVLHFAAESHVDRSITGPEDFVVTNCVGTNVVMQACRAGGDIPGGPHFDRRGVRLGRGGAQHRDRSRWTPVRPTAPRRRDPT